MIKEEEQLYLQNIEEYIFEENKIVTYQWLCKTLDIHVNLAKQLLHTFAIQDSVKDKVSTSYLLAGVPKNGIGYHVAVVKDVNISKEKEAFQTVTSEHVYSVQKENALTDLNLLYNVDVSDGHKNNNYKRLSSINYDVVERDPAVLVTLRAAALPVPSKQPIAALKKPPPKPVAKSPKKQLSPKKGSPKKLSSPKKEVSPKKTSVSEKEQLKENDKPTIASMFANAPNKKTTVSKNTKNVKDTKPKPKGIGAFFNKVPQKEKQNINESEKKEVVKMEVDEETGISSKTQNKDSSDIKEEERSSEKQKIDVDKNEKKTDSDKNEKKTDSDKNKKKTDSPKVLKGKSTKSQSKEKESKGKKRTKKSNDKEKVVKKRKRIIAMSDSESSSDEGEDESSYMDVVRESTPPPEPTIVKEESEDEEVIQCTPQLTSKRHRRRLVDRNYLDEAGYMCTTKEYVTESCSDEEEEETKEINKSEESKPSVEEKSEAKSVKKSAPKSKPSKKASPQKTKQTNLMSFFGKKS